MGFIVYIIVSFHHKRLNELGIMNDLKRGVKVSSKNNDIVKIEVKSEWQTKGGNIIRKVVAVENGAVFTIDINDGCMIDPKGHYRDSFLYEHEPYLGTKEKG